MRTCKTFPTQQTYGLLPQAFFIFHYTKMVKLSLPPAKSKMLLFMNLVMAG